MMRRAVLLLAGAAIAPVAPAFAQDHSAHAMPATGHEDHQEPQDHEGHQGHQGHAMPASQTPATTPPPAGHDHDAHAGHDMSAMHGGEPAGTDLPAGNAAPPPIPMDHYADRQFSHAEMEESRQLMMRESGGQTIGLIMFNLAEYHARAGRDGYRWDGEAWIGGDINRLTLKTEGEGAFRQGIEAAEVQALYSRAIGPYFNLQAGIRHDLEPGPSRTHAVIGFEGLAPYWFEVEGALFLSDKGDLSGRLDGYYDQRLTQRLVLQPRAELNLSAQDVPEHHIGAGLSSAELGLRLRYEISRRFAPYIGLSHDAKIGRTARYARNHGESATSTSFVAGLRIWF